MKSENGHCKNCIFPILLEVYLITSIKQIKFDMRILIKISGEALSNSKSSSHDHEYIRGLCGQIQSLVHEGFEVALVTGGGNICRGEIFAKGGVWANVAHEVGMLATVINGLLLQDNFHSLGQDCTLYTAREISAIGEIFHARKAQDGLKNKSVAILAGGTWNPYFTTDTASVLRSIELGCDMMIKCTSVDGIYSADPKKDSLATKFETITYDDVLAKNLRVMDQTAIALAREHSLKIGICHIDSLPLLVGLLKDKFSGSIIQK
jgi:uridylate kinase